MQSLLESLLNYILRHHYETLLRGSWNYVHYLRHHHELSLRGHEITSITWGTTMNSHQEDHGITSITWGTTMNSHQEVHGITFLYEAPPWTLTKRFMELRPNHTKAMFHQPATIDQSRTISSQYLTNQPTIHVFHFILNRVKSHSHLISYNIRGNHTSCFYNKTFYQADKQPHQRTNQN